jgi:hypothetical protein
LAIAAWKWIFTDGKQLYLEMMYYATAMLVTLPSLRKVALARRNNSSDSPFSEMQQTPFHLSSFAQTW